MFETEKSISKREYAPSLKLYIIVSTFQLVLEKKVGCKKKVKLINSCTIILRGYVVN